MRDKKGEERIVASFLLKKVAPQALPHMRDGPEEPDFLTMLDGGNVGIEIRSLRDDLISGSDALAAAEGMQDSVVARALEIYKSRGLPTALVYVLWKPSGARRRNTRGIAQSLVDAVASVVTGPLPVSGFEAAAVEGTVLPDAGVARLRVYRTAKLTRASWFSLRGGWATPCPSSAIQRALDAKETRLPTYRKKAPICG
jgi:hypothetical protein